MNDRITSFAILFAAICTGCLGTAGTEAAIFVQPKSVVAFVGQPFTVQTRIIWRGAKRNVRVSTTSLGDGTTNSVADLTGEYVLDGASGDVNESSRFQCQSPGEFERVFFVEGGESGSTLGSATMLILCLVPTPDGLGDQFYSDPAFSPGRTPGFTDIGDSGAGIIEVTAEAADNLNEESEEEVAAPMFLHVLDQGFSGFQAGEYVAVATRVEEMIPTADEELDNFYSVVLETDGRTENNWLTQGTLDLDQFQGADRFYQTKWDASAMGWSMSRIIVGDDQSQTTMPTNAVFTIRGDMATWLIPRSELGQGDLFYRVATFTTLNESFDPQDSGGDVNGEDPTIALTQILTY